MLERHYRAKGRLRRHATVVIERMDRGRQMTSHRAISPRCALPWRVAGR
jgi:hypothetical protein